MLIEENLIETIKVFDFFRDNSNIEKFARCCATSVSGAIISLVAGGQMSKVAVVNKTTTRPDLE